MKTGKRILRLGVSGLGVGMDHAVRLEKLGLGITAGVFDPATERIGLATKQSVNYGAITIFNSFEEMVKASNIDAVIIASPNHIHAQQVDCAARYKKPIFLEKPLAPTLSECMDIYRAVKDSKVICQVGLVYRYSPYFNKVMELVHSGLIGKVQLLYIHEFVDWIRQPEWRNSQSTSGGALLEKNCHHFDLFNWALKDQVKARKIVAFGGKNHYKDRGVIDNATVAVEYENGVRANLMLCLFAKYSGLEMGIIGDKGKLVCHMDGPEVPRKDSIVFYPKDPNCRDVTTYDVDYNMEFENCKIYPEAIHGTSWGHSGNVREVEEFAQTVATGIPPISNIDIGLHSMLIPLAAEQSIAEQRIVSMDELYRQIEC